jgi:hypothetical protein
MCKCSWANYGHQTYGECLRSKNLRIAYCGTGTNEKNDYSRQRELDRDLDFYASARRQGIQPDSLKRDDVAYALDSSDKTGIAYDAGQIGFGPLTPEQVGDALG